MIAQAQLEASCDTSDDWARLQTLLLQLEKAARASTLETLIEQVDQSDFSLADWIQALLLFDRWLDHNNIAARPVANMIAYIHCCTISLTDSLPPPDLATLTGKMLKQYGFDAAIEIEK